MARKWWQNVAAKWNGEFKKNHRTIGWPSWHVGPVNDVWSQLQMNECQCWTQTPPLLHDVASHSSVGPTATHHTDCWLSTAHRNVCLPAVIITTGKPRPHQQQCRSNFRLCWQVETNWTCSVCFDFVERIVRLVAFDNVASTLLLMWTGL